MSRSHLEHVAQRILAGSPCRRGLARSGNRLCAEDELRGQRFSSPGAPARRGERDTTSLLLPFARLGPIPLLEMYTKITTFRTGCPHARPVIPRVLEPMAEVSLGPELVTDGLLPWADAPQALPGNRSKLVFSRAGAPCRERWPGARRRSDCLTVMSIPA